jgi:UDP-N-acetylmuramoyl-tripeptide--D-alanyl-D-alanine ligase
MITLTLPEIAAITGGTLHDAADPAVPVTGLPVCDSRQAGPGSLFAAITGARADGHDFAGQAFIAGAACVLGTRPVGGPAVVVPDVTEALGRLARYALGQAVGATVIGLTGSAGKTTTKDLLAHVLAGHGPVVATPGSFNTQIGLPLTVLRAEPGTRYLVLEMGARHVGDIRYLTTLTPPQVGIVLNVGSAHLGEFGGREAIAAAKSELVQALPDAAGGIAVLNADDPLVSAMSARTRARVISYGTGHADVRADEITLTGGRASFALVTPSGSAPVSLRHLGVHQVHNALAVAAAGYGLGLPPGAVADALSTAQPSPSRLQVSDGPDGVTVINDAFNANPESMAAGLRAFTAYSGGRRKVAVLGEMRELGTAADDAHQATGRLAAELGVDVLVVVGDGPVRHLAEAAAASQPAPAVRTVAGPEALRRELAALVEPGDVVFIKASRSIGLENFRLHASLEPGAC